MARPRSDRACCSADIWAPNSAVISSVGFRPFVTAAACISLIHFCPRQRCVLEHCMSSPVKTKAPQKGHGEQFLLQNLPTVPFLPFLRTPVGVFLPYALAVGLKLWLLSDYSIAPIYGI